MEHLFNLSTYKPVKTVSKVYFSSNIPTSVIGFLLKIRDYNLLFLCKPYDIDCMICAVTEQFFNDKVVNIVLEYKKLIKNPGISPVNKLLSSISFFK